ncbi:hypothetical protein ACTHR6_01180 [Ralstonia holmesii]|uniref:hypothetical protein n=1 Tax=Ralstonia TaxID=48736 RepID=UPI000AE7ACAE|nr:hypothetical protein [Ralstonia pickettii]
MSKGHAYRFDADKPLTEPQSWDSVVRHLLGPRFVGDPADKRRCNAIQLAAAALRAAGDDALARQISSAAHDAPVTPAPTK